MSRTDYTIDELYGEEWREAIYCVMDILNECRSKDNKLFYERDAFLVDEIAGRLNCRFTKDGTLVR